MDAFQEFYHAPVLHANQTPTAYSKAAAQAGFEAPHYRIDGPHRLVSTSGVRALGDGRRNAQADRGHLPERSVRAVGRSRSRAMPVGLNPAKCEPWGLDSFQLFPNFVILFWGQGWYLTYHYWPTSYNTHTFECTLYFPQPRTPRERLGQELAAATFKEYGLQDANTLEATQTSIESRAVEEFLYCDQEILLRHLHKERPHRGSTPTSGRVSNVLPVEFADLEQFSDWCLATEAQRYSKRLGSTMVEMQPFYDAITARAEEAITYCDKISLDDMPEDVLNLMRLLYSMVTVSFSVECWNHPGAGFRSHPAGLRIGAGSVTVTLPAGRPLGRCRHRRDPHARRGGPESGTRGCFQHSTENDTVTIEYSRRIRLSTSSRAYRRG